jgi:hypothetical protein
LINLGGGSVEKAEGDKGPKEVTGDCQQKQQKPRPEQHAPEFMRYQLEKHSHGKAKKQTFRKNQMIPIFYMKVQIKR